METPAGRSRSHATPGSGRRRSAIKTPKSVLTPNDDAAEKASIRRKRRSEALRLSLSDAFAEKADQQRTQQQAGGHGDSRPQLTEEQCAVLLEQCLKLATENKITDRNAWHLQLITYLPDIVGSGSTRTSGSSSYNFQKMSGGLDAGVTIFSKRVDLTYKEALSLGSYAPAKSGDGADEGGEGEDGEEADDLEDAAAAAAKAQKQKGRGKRAGGSAEEASTLTTPEQLRAKKGDTTLAVDPLFHTMSALFDEGGAKGLLLLNRSVYDGAHIMTCPHDLPEQQFPLQPLPQQDALLDLRPLQQQLAACSSSSSQAAAAVLTPGLQQLYTLLEQTRRTLPGGQKQQQQQTQGLDVAAVMQQALYRLPATPMPRPVSSTAAGMAAGTAAAAANTASAADADTSADTDMADGSSSSPAGGGQDSRGTAHLGPSSSSLPVVASFLAETAAEDEAAAAAAAAAGADDDVYGEAEDGFGPDGGYSDAGVDAGDCGHPGFEDDGGDMAQEQQQRAADRRQSLLGLGAEQAAADEDSCLDAEALQQLLGAAAGRKGATTSKAGWAGSRFWKYNAAAAATARMASGGSSEPVRRAAAGGAGSRSRSAAARIDFTQPPPDLEATLASGSRKQTCLVTAPTSSSRTGTLLPEDLHYQASSLLQLFLRPTPISFMGRHQQQGSGRANNGPQQLPSWAEEGGGDDGWGDGYSDGGYGDEGGDGYNAGDLSVGDPGFSHSQGGTGGSGSSSGEWWSADGELLSAPKRMTARGVNYQRSAKQVDVRALKDLLWDSLVQVNTQHATTTADASPTTTPTTAAADRAAAAGGSGAAVIPFEDVIVHVPQQSAAGSLADVSVHMCFICLLHLANEKGLVVKAQGDLRTLTISNVQDQQEEQEAH